MRGFARRQTVEAALAWLEAHLRPPDAEILPLQMAVGRVLAKAISSDVDVPGFDRATMDGYAVVAESTQGASAYTRLPLTVVGDSRPGHPFDRSVDVGEAVRIMTGAPLPRGCDAVLPAEWVEGWVEVESGGPGGISALAAVSPGKHVGTRGEDVARGTMLFQAGRVLRPQDLGVLSSVGVGDVPVYSRPRVRLVITGDELVPAGSRPHGYHIVDANGPMLAALVARDGGLVDFPRLVPDEPDAILNAAAWTLGVTARLAEGIRRRPSFRARAPTRCGRCPEAYAAVPEC